MLFSLEVLDKINAIVEFICIIPAILQIRKIIKVKTVESISFGAQSWYIGCLTWWMFYTVQLSQIWSFYAIIIWAILAIAETYLIVYYKYFYNKFKIPNFY